jgi:uncharacterized protein
VTASSHPAAPWGAPERPDLPAPRGDEPPAPPAAPDAAARWRPWTAFGALGGALLVVVFGGMVVSVLASAFGADIEDPPAGVNIGLTMFQGLVFIAAALYFAQLSAVPRATQFGLRRPPKAWLAVALVPATWLAFILLSALWVTVIGESPDEDLPDDLGAEDSDVALVAVMVLVCVIAPVGEEFLFRGYMFRALRNWKGLMPAAVISGVVFGLIHALSADPIALLPLAVLGVGLALLYHWSGSLYASMALHALNNAIAFGVSQDWGWQIALLIPGGIAATLAVAYGLARAIDAGHARIERTGQPGVA